MPFNCIKYTVELRFLNLHGKQKLVREIGKFEISIHYHLLVVIFYLIQALIYFRAVKGYDSPDVIFVERFQNTLQVRREYKRQYLISTE